MLEDQHNVKAWFYLAPALVLLSLFIFYPIVTAFFLSFLDNYNYVRDTFDGFTLTKNFQNAVTHPDFRWAFQNTAIITFVAVPVSVMLSLLISAWLNGIKKFQGFFQTVFFLPYVTNAIAVGMAFAFLFNRQYGLINEFLGLFGVNPINWVGEGASYPQAVTALIIYIVWLDMAFKILVFLSGLQGISQQYYEAARVDSASRVRIFRRITIPLLSPMILYITVTSFIGAFKAYTQVIGMFGVDLGPKGDPNQLITVVGVVYQNLGRPEADGAFSEAAATSLILFAVTLIFTLLNFQVSKKRVHY